MARHPDAGPPVSRHPTLSRGCSAPVADDPYPGPPVPGHPHGAGWGCWHRCPVAGDPAPGAPVSWDPFCRRRRRGKGDPSTLHPFIRTIRRGCWHREPRSTHLHPRLTRWGRARGRVGDRNRATDRHQQSQAHQHQPQRKGRSEYSTSSMSTTDSLRYRIHCSPPDVEMHLRRPPAPLPLWALVEGRIPSAHRQPFITGPQRRQDTWRTWPREWGCVL